MELVFATDRCHALEDPWRDSAVAVRFHELDNSVDAVLEGTRTRPIDGVIAVGDRPVVLAARIAAALGLPGNPPDAALASAHKRLARECFARAGLPTPWFVPARIDESIEPLFRAVRYPAVIKPVALSGSRGVMRVDSSAELETAFRRITKLLSRPEILAQRTGAERDLLIEGFVPGREFAVEAVLTHGAFRPLAVFDKPDPLNGPFFEETIYVTRDLPPNSERADADGIERRILQGVERAARALGLSHGPIHAECRVNREGVFVLEVAARPIGGLCSRVLRFAMKQVRESAGSTVASADAGVVSLEHLLLQHAAGRDVRMLQREAAAAAVMMIPIPRRGVFRGGRGEQSARSVPFVEEVRITAKEDQLLEPLPEAGSYLGFIFARAPQASEAELAVRTAHRHLTFTIDPAIDVMQGSRA